MTASIPHSRMRLRKLRLTNPKSLNAWIAVISSVLLLLATVSTAFCVFQATLEWSSINKFWSSFSVSYRIS
ncbi:MAG: hypothetical protein WBF08_06930 [Candidatus Bathyarchaeia archaeon]